MDRFNIKVSIGLTEYQNNSEEHTKLSQKYNPAEALHKNSLVTRLDET